MYMLFERGLHESKINVNDHGLIIDDHGLYNLYKKIILLASI